MTTYTRTMQFNSRRQSTWKRNRNTVAFASAIKLGPITHTVLIALLITILGLIYLAQATHTVSYGYEASKIDDKISALSEQKKDLEVDNARLTALKEVQSSSVAKTMTTPANTAYASE